MNSTNFGMPARRLATVATATALATGPVADKSSAAPQALQALNAVNEDFFIPWVGFFAFMPVGVWVIVASVFLA